MTVAGRPHGIWRTITHMKHFLILLAGVVFWPAMVSQAQQTTAPAVSEESIAKPKPSAKENALAQAQLLDSLLARLQNATDKSSASAIENAIWQLWLRHPSSSVDVLMKQAINAMNAEKNKEAIMILGTVIELAPDYAEAWNKRATVYFYSGEFERSLADIAQVLDIEPRHFGALSGLGLVQQELGNKKAALRAFRQALEIHPFLPGARAAVDHLKEEVEGEPI